MVQRRGSATNKRQMKLSMQERQALVLLALQTQNGDAEGMLQRMRRRYER